MKQLVCEMCGSTDMLKQEGVFVCQNCGTKYSVEEAKKMMVEIEGTVEVQGTVRVDESSKIENYLSLAEVAIEGENITEAIKHIDKVLELDVNNYKAWMLRAKTIGWGSTLADKKISESVAAAKKAIDLTPDENKQSTADELVDFLSLQVVGLYSLALKMQAVSLVEGSKQAHEVMLTWISVLKLPYVSKEKIRENISLCETMYTSSKDSTSPISRCMYAAASAYNNKEPYYVTFKKELLPDELTEEDKNAKTGGCYVATCVYGSYDCPEVWTLRRFRDDTLGSTWYGRLFIHLYYAISPTLVKWFGNTNWFKNLWRGTLNRMVANLQAKGVEDTPYEDKIW